VQSGQGLTPVGWCGTAGGSRATKHGIDVPHAPVRPTADEVEPTVVGAEELPHLHPRLFWTTEARQRASSAPTPAARAAPTTVSASGA
jgi:hypothetical protein